MFSFYTFRAVLVALPLALTTAAGQAVAHAAGPPVGHPAPKKAAAADKASPAALPAQASAAALATVSVAPPASQLVQLKGLVLNPDGRPCPGASVFPAGAPRQLVVTNAKGAFVLSVPADTALVLQVEYFGVGSSRVAVDKPSAEPLRITLGQ
ncbi:hypothetical protein A0257_20380 [Hymenobacter psoromatis]|nr:hypothetical protein A0257_20380 [Hymenobacter psoromatis]